MLLIDGVKYHEWTPTNEKEFERIVSEHASEIFGENSIYIDRKLKLQSLSGIGSIPDGYVITFKGAPQWHIIEVELSSHDLYNHIVPQVGRFIRGINNLSTQKIVAEAIYHAIISEELLYMRMDKVVQSGEIYKFLADLISKPPVITIVIEKDTPELGDALSALAHPTKNVVELRTFTREEIGLPVHAHLFEPLYQAPPEKTIITTEVTKEEIAGGELIKSGRKVIASDFTHKGDGIFALKLDPSITIDVKKTKRVLRQQLAKQELRTKNLPSFRYSLRKEADLLHRPTED